MIRLFPILLLLAVVSSCRKDIEVDFHDGGGSYVSEDSTIVEINPIYTKDFDSDYYAFYLGPNSRLEPFLKTIIFRSINVCLGDTIFFSNTAETVKSEPRALMATLYATDYILTEKLPYNNGTKQNWLYFDYVGRKQREVKGSFSLVLKRDGDEIRPWIPSTEFSVCRNGQFRAFLIPD